MSTYVTLPSYPLDMSQHEPPLVYTSREAREALGQVMNRFRADDATPLIFGAHRKPEAVVIPYSMYREIIPLLEDLEIARTARERLAAGPATPLDDLAASVGVDLSSQ
jgi:hypothetical protein